MTTLDAYAQAFADVLFAAFPDFRALARAEPGGSLLVERSAPGDRPHGVLWISTAGEEITIGFDAFHTHFDWPGEDPVAFLRDLLEDRQVVESWWLDGRWTGSSVHAAQKRPDLSGLKPGHRVVVRSWSGRLDATFGQGPPPES